MSSRRKSRSRERKNLPSKLRMDDNIPPPRITDPSLPAGRRREIDNVMKKARAQNSPTSSAIWEKKLLEVEAKDSNRWRHSGYKSLYLDGGTSSRSRSRSRSFSSTRRGGAGASSPSPRRARSPRARSPRSPPPRARSPRSPPPRGRSPRSPPSRRVASPPMGYRGGRPRTPPSPRKRKLNRKRKARRQARSRADDVFKPDWFAYDQMAKFLESVYSQLDSPRETKSSEGQSEDRRSVINVDVLENSAVSENPTPDLPNSITFKAPSSAKAADSKKRKMDEAYNFLKAMRHKPDEDECSLFSELLCQKLRALNKNMRDIAMHEIDCLMFRFKQQQQSLPVDYFQQQVPSVPSDTQRIQFAQSFHSQPPSGYPSSLSYPRSQPSLIPSPHSHSQPSPGFPPSPHSDRKPSPEFPPSPHSHSQPSPEFPPSPRSHPQPTPVFSLFPYSHSPLQQQYSPESFAETLDSMLKV